MKKLLRIALLTMLLAGSASAQLVDLFHYQADQNFTLLGLPAGAMAITRFQVDEAAKLHEINVWFYNQEAAGDSVVVYLFGKEGGGAYPLLLAPVATIKAFIPAQFNNLVRFNFDQQQPTFVRPTNFFVGVQIMGTNVKVRMDNITQTPACATSEGDTMYTSSYWQNLQPPYIPFNGRLASGMATNNWYVGVKVEYMFQNQDLFADATLMAGLNNIMPSGRRVSVADFDQDGFQDILYGKYLLRNNGNGRFTDISSNSGYDGGSQVNMFADIDNDGDLDIVCAPATLQYINNNGLLTKDTEPGFNPGRNTTAMAIADYDSDNYLDIFVANGEYMYVKNPQNANDSAMVQGAAWEGFFYGNTQNGKFRDIKGQILGGYRSGAYGRNPYNTQQTVQGYRPITGANWVDADLDGDLDLYCSVNRLQPNFLFENQGTGFMREVAMQHGLQGVVKTDPNYVGLFGNTRGCDFADADNDGDPDLFVGEAAEKWRLGAGDLTALWKNSGKPNSQFSQVPGTTTKLGFQLIDGDVAWGDFDNDGLQDVMLTPGEHCFNGALYKQNPDGSFTNLIYESTIDATNSLGAVWLDYDNDGDLDLALATEVGLKLYRNDLAVKGNWLTVNARSKTSNVFGVGARVEAIVGATKYTRWITVGKGAGSQTPYAQHIGIGQATAVDSVVVYWPNGTRTSMRNPEINKIHNLIEADPVSVGGTPLANGMALHQNYPNPFSRSQAAGTRIGFELQAASDVALHVYDSRGALVRTLLNSRMQAGTHEVAWNGNSDEGTLLATGVYNYVLTVNGATTMRQAILMK